MMIRNQHHAEGPSELHNTLFQRERDSSRGSLASTIDQNNLWKYKPEHLQKSAKKLKNYSPQVDSNQ